MQLVLLILVVFGVMVKSTFQQQNQNSDICEGIPDGQFVRDPYDCSRFYHCADGIETGVNCPPGMLFDNVENMCNFEGNVECVIEQEPESTTSGTTTTVAPERTTLPSTTNSVEEEFCRNADPTVPNFTASSTDCGQYYICIDGKPFPLKCARGKHWNQQMQYCDEPEKVDCQIITSTIHFPKCPPRGYAFFPHPEICEFFLYCDNGMQSVQRCPYHYQWHSEMEMCVLKDLLDCTKTSVSEHKWI